MGEGLGSAPGNADTSVQMVGDVLRGEPGNNPGVGEAVTDGQYKGVAFTAFLNPPEPPQMPH